MKPLPRSILDKTLSSDQTLAFGQNPYLGENKASDISSASVSTSARNKKKMSK